MKTSSEEDSMLAFKGSAAATERKKVPAQKFLPAYPCLVPLRKGSKFVLCTSGHLQIGLLMQAWRSI